MAKVKELRPATEPAGPRYLQNSNMGCLYKSVLDTPSYYICCKVDGDFVLVNLETGRCLNLRVAGHLPGDIIRLEHTLELKNAPIEE